MLFIKTSIYNYETNFTFKPFYPPYLNWGINKKDTFILRCLNLITLMNSNPMSLPLIVGLNKT